MIAGGQIAGARGQQEDRFRIAAVGAGDGSRWDLLMVVADGMGGHRGGAEASRVAVGSFVEGFAGSGGGVATRLRMALEGANDAVGGFAQANPRYEGMGCTLVGCVVTAEDRAHWVSVGDSPLWRVREGGDSIERLNADHSMRPVLEKLAESGGVTAAEVRGPSAQVLRSALTGEALTLVDDGGEGVDLGLGDSIVVASDGMETLAGGELLLLSGGGGGAANVVSDMLSAVEKRAAPSQDNATVVVYRHSLADAWGRRLGGAQGA